MLSGLRLYGAIGIAAALAIFIGFALHWKHQASDRGEKLAVICDTTRTAADNPKLACGRVAVQIAELGKSVTTLKAGIATQNDAVDAMAAKSKADQAAAAQASQAAQARARGAEATAERLRASARGGGALSGSQGQCEPSKTVKEIWR